MDFVAGKNACEYLWADTAQKCCMGLGTFWVLSSQLFLGCWRAFIIRDMAPLRF